MRLVSPLALEMEWSSPEPLDDLESLVSRWTRIKNHRLCHHKAVCPTMDCPRLNDDGRPWTRQDLKIVILYRPH